MPDFNCQIEVRAASSPWTDPYVLGGPGTTFPVVRSSYVARRGMVADPTAVETNSLNVQAIVTYWLSNRRPNEGFVLQQRMVDGRGASHENSDSCTNIYSNATLELVVRRFVPREP
jgi:hypothetical protein